MFLLQILVVKLAKRVLKFILEQTNKSILEIYMVIMQSNHNWSMIGHISRKVIIVFGGMAKTAG